MTEQLSVTNTPIVSENAPVLVLFGGTGDLSNRKLIPAVYNLSYQSLDEGKSLPFRVLAIGRRDWDAQVYISSVRQWVKSFTRKKFTDEYFEKFSQCLDYYQLDINDTQAYRQLYEYLLEFYPNSKRLYYYAVAPRFFKPISVGLKTFPQHDQDARVIIEKPFGEDLQQAKRLHEAIAASFGEKNVYHIDHYLGKEMIQNIHTLRFENMIFKSCWNKDYIESIEITASETVGVETRGGYYDHAGAMRDMVQNHLFQILSILAMEEPEKDNAYSLTVAQQNVLQALRPIEKSDVNKVLCLGQYEGYRQEDKVDPQSMTDTYASLVVHIDNPRWAGVPFFIRTGKKLAKRGTFVVVNFRKTSGSCTPNQLMIEIQPSEGVKLNFNIKKPGISSAIEAVNMHFCQSCQVDAQNNTPEAYERLLQAAWEGKHELFSQWPQIEFSWEWVDKLVDTWKQADQPMATYPQGSCGPLEAEQMLQSYGAQWFDLRKLELD